MLRLRLLKSFEVSLGEEPLTGMGPQVHRLLVYLALKAGAWVEKEVVCRDLRSWSKKRASYASLTKENLRQQIHRLGEALGSEAFRLESESGAVRLNLQGAEVDFIAFNALVAQGTPVALQQAIQIYRGDLLADAELNPIYFWHYEWDSWVKPARTELHARYRHAVVTLQSSNDSQPVIDPGTTSIPFLEFPGGGVPLDSPFYIERPQDAEIRARIVQPGQTLLINGPRQIGKTSLLNRALHVAEQAGARTLITDWQSLAESEIATSDALFATLADLFAYHLKLESTPEETFHPRRANSTNFERYVRDHVLKEITGPLVWGIDEADRLFSCAFRDDIFGKLRAWHNDRSRHDSPFRRLTIVMAYSTEAWLFIKDLNASPFNVGAKFILQDLTTEQTAELNRRYRHPLSSTEEVAQLQALTNGHPYLVRVALHTMRQRGMTMRQITVEANRDEGIFTEHLSRIRLALASDPELREVVRKAIQERISPTDTAFVRLRASGLMTGETPRLMRPRCPLYALFLDRYFQA